MPEPILKRPLRPGIRARYHQLHLGTLPRHDLKRVRQVNQPLPRMQPAQKQDERLVSRTGRAALNTPRSMLSPCSKTFQE